MWATCRAAGVDSDNVKGIDERGQSGRRVGDCDVVALCQNTNGAVAMCYIYSWGYLEVRFAYERITYNPLKKLAIRLKAPVWSEE
jgi:hypothetical protein